VLPLRDINPTRITPVLTLLLIAANVLVFFLLQHPTDPEEQARFTYEHAVIACEVVTGAPLTVTEIRRGVCSTRPGRPVFPDKNVYAAAIVSLFLHGSVLHLLANMWFLWIFGNNVEEAFGRLGYALLYLLAGVTATAAFVAAQPASTFPLVGASGAIAGVLGAYAVLFPRAQVLTLLFVFFVPIPAIVFLVLWFVSQFSMPDPSVAWQAHVAGFLFGAAVAGVFRAPLRARLARIHHRAPVGPPIA